MATWDLPTAQLVWPTLVGLRSWGKGCAWSPSLSGVRLGSWLPWIQVKVWLSSKVGYLPPCPPPAQVLIMVRHKAPLNGTWLLGAEAGCQPCTEGTEIGRDRYPRQREAQRVSMKSRKERRKEGEKEKTKRGGWQANREKPYFPQCLLGRQSSLGSCLPPSLSLLSSLPRYTEAYKY